MYIHLFTFQLNAYFNILFKKKSPINIISFLIVLFIPSQARCTRYHIMWSSLSVACDRSVGFLRELTCIVWPYPSCSNLLPFSLILIIMCRDHRVRRRMAIILAFRSLPSCIWYSLCDKIYKLDIHGASSMKQQPTESHGATLMHIILTLIQPVFVLIYKLLYISVRFVG
jgi:hypothetical protein